MLFHWRMSMVNPSFVKPLDQIEDFHKRMWELGYHYKFEMLGLLEVRWNSRYSMLEIEKRILSSNYCKTTTLLVWVSFNTIPKLKYKLIFFIKWNMYCLFLLLFGYTNLFESSKYLICIRLFYSGAYWFHMLVLTNLIPSTLVFVYKTIFFLSLQLNKLSSKHKNF